MTNTRGAPYCCVMNCSNNGRTSIDPRTGKPVRLFHFPNRETDRERCQKWIINIRRDDLKIADIKSRRVCSVHFHEKAFNCPTDIQYCQLLPTAVPTIVSCPNPPPSRNCRRPPPKIREPVPKGRQQDTDDAPASSSVYDEDASGEGSGHAPVKQPSASSPVSSAEQPHPETAETASTTAQKSAPSSMKKQKCRTRSSGTAKSGKKKCDVDSPQTANVVKNKVDRQKRGKVKAVKNSVPTPQSEEVPTQDETEVNDWSNPVAHVIEAKEPGIVGTCIQMAIYLLKTMEEFESVEYEVRYLPKNQKPVLHLRRRDLYGKLGWPGDPVTTTLTMQGLLTHRVVYCAPRSAQLAHGNKLVVDKFITEIGWLTSVTSLCLGVSRDITPTAQPLPGLVSFSSPEPRVQSETCPLVVFGRQRRCAGCRQQVKDQRSQHNDTGDPHSSNDSDDTLPVYFETDESPSQRKKRKLSKASPSVLRKHKRSKPNSSSILLPTEIGIVRNMHSDDNTEPSDIGCETGSVNLSTSVMRSTHSGITEPSDNGSMSLSTTDAGELHNSIAIKVEPDTIKEEPDYDGIYIENDRAEEDMLVGDTHSSYVTCKQESLNLSASFTFQPPTAVHKGVADTVTQDSIATTAVQDNGAVTAVHSNLAATVAQDSEAATATEDSIEASVVLNGLIIKRDPDYDDSELETDDTFVGIKQDSSWKQDSSVFDLHTNSVTHSHLSTSDPRSIPSSPGTDWVSLPIQQEPTEPPAVTHTHSDDSNYCLWLQHIHHKT